MTDDTTGAAGYGLVPPTRDDALAFLARAIGPDRAASTWVRAAAAAGVSTARRELDTGELLKVAECLAAEPGAVGAIGNSLVVRLRTFRLLSAHQPERDRRRD